MPPGSMQGLLFNTDDIDAMHATLTAAGSRLASEVSPGARYCTFRDPDGNGYVSSRPPHLRNTRSARSANSSARGRLPVSIGQESVRVGVAHPGLGLARG
nr:hypothetical protein [Deltaproteobacteria bacterium]